MAFAQAQILQAGTSSSTNPSLSFSGSPTDGNLLVLVLRVATPRVVSELTLPAGYTARVAIDAGTGGGFLVIADRIAATSPKPQTCTLVSSTWDMIIFEWSGVAASGYVDDVTIADTGSTASIQPGSLSPAGPGELFIVAARQASSNGGSEAIGSGFTADATATLSRLIVGHKVKGGADSAAENPTLSWSTPQGASAGMVAYSTVPITPGVGQPTARRFDNVPHVRLGRGGPVQVGG